MTTRNLLTAPPSAEELEKELQTNPPVSILPVYGDARWAEIALRPSIRHQVKQFVEFASAEASLTMPELTPAMYRAYQEHGERIQFDLSYLERRRMLGQTAMAALLRPSSNALTDALYRRWEETLEERSWTGTAHESSTSKQRVDRPDLKATEAAATLAEICSIFRHVAPRHLVQETEQRLQRMLDFYITAPDPLETWFVTWHNWNAVCHYGLLSIGLHIPMSSKKLAEALSRMAAWLPNYLRGFALDGGTSEGIAYWNYGFSRFAWLNHALETASNMRYSLIEKDARIPEIVRFGIRMFVPPESQINFADAPASGRLCPGLISYLAERLDQPDLRSAARMLWQINVAQEPDWCAKNTQRLHFLQLSRRFLFAPRSIRKTTVSRWPVRKFYLPHLQVWNVRGEDRKTGLQWSVAAKGGHNEEGHNHNDCGSYIVHLNGHPLISELGTPQYDGNYFRDRRYTFLAASSLGHSVPAINGREQIPGESAASTVLKHSTSPDRFSLDLTRCYPTESCCEEVRRDFSIKRTPFCLAIKDSFRLTAAAPVESVVITTSHVTQLDPQTVRIGNEACKLLLTAYETGHIAAIEKKTFTDDIGITHPVTRIIIRPQGRKKSAFSIKYSVTISS